LSAASAKTAQLLIRVLSPLAGEPRAQWLVARGYALVYLARYYVAAQYGKALLGMFWVAIAPLLLAAVYLPIFLFKFNPELPNQSRVDYALFCLVGLMAWAAFSDGVSQGSGALVSNASIVRHAPTPPSMLPIVKVLGAFSGLGAGLLAFILGLAVAGRFPGTRLLMLPVAFGLLLLATLGIALAFAVLGAYLRDLIQALPTLLAVEFFAAPVVYAAPDPFASKTGLLIQLNPFTPFLALFRYSLLTWGDLPWRDLAFAVGWAVALLLVGTLLFRRLEGGLGDVV
jgi:lipopolysaccharide transport system permease protein